MNSANFKVERSNLGTYLRTSTYKYSILNFLENHDMLKEKYKVLVTPLTTQKITVLYVPVKLANKIPFILVATSCGQLNNCLYNTNNLKLIKSRVKNYYCEDFFKKVVSIFGNEKAWDEFKIDNEWKPKLKFTKVEHEWCEPSTSYFSFMTYKKCIHRKTTINRSTYVHNVKLVTGVYWNDNKEKFVFKGPILLNKLNDISKIKISRTLNNPKKKDIREFKKIIECVDDNKNLLTKDGIKLQQDLSLIRALVL